MLPTILLLGLTILRVSSFANVKCGGKRYKCGLENQQNVCVNVSEYRGKEHELKICPDDQICLWDSAEYQKPVYCTPKPTPEGTSLPGEYCSKDSDCKSSSCQQGVCLGKQGQKCANHDECDVGFYCQVNVCAKQRGFEEECDSDFACQNNSVCNKGKCAFYYSLENNIQADNPYSCLHGYIHPNGTCQVGPHSQIKSRPCETDQDCLLLDQDEKLFGYSKCECGFNAGGFSYCSLAEGDEEYLKIIELFQWLLQVNQYCHTLLRYGPCKSLYSDEVLAYQRAVKFYEMRSRIQFNDDCIRSIYTPQFWKLRSITLSALLITMILIN